MDTRIKGYDEFRDSLRAAVGVYFTTGDLPFTDIDLPTWIPVSDIDKGADGKVVNLEKIRLCIPLFDSGVSLRISMYLAYDKEMNAFYYIPRNGAALEAHKKMIDDYPTYAKADDDNPPVDTPGYAVLSPEERKAISPGAWKRLCERIRRDLDKVAYDKANDDNPPA